MLCRRWLPEDSDLEDGVLLAGQVMLELHLDPVGGISGDMFVAALLDYRPDLETELRQALELCPLIEAVTVTLAAHDDGILTGHRFLVRKPGQADEGPPTEHEHSHTDWRVIREALQASRLDQTTVNHAINIFSHLAEAEAKVHNVSPDAVRFHEVGAWDSITDIVASAWLIARLGVARWTVSALPLGSGRVRTAHGVLPVPAPATTLLLQGFTMINDGFDGERVTPTGAAILQHLGASEEAPHGTTRRLTGTAHGFGSHTLPGVSNCLRLLAFETAEIPCSEGCVAQLECEIDDQSGEDLAQAVEMLRAREDVLDIVQMPVFGKKGRIMTHLRILADPTAREAVLAAVFDETTTIGIRHALIERSTLPRHTTEIESGGHTLRVKTVERPSGRTTKLESDELVGIPGSAARDRLRRLAKERGDTEEDR